MDENMGSAKAASKTTRDAIRVDLKNIVETAWKIRVGISEIWDRLFGPPPPMVDKKAPQAEPAPPFGLVQIVETGLDEIRHAQNDTYEILADILARL